MLRPTAFRSVAKRAFSTSPQRSDFARLSVLGRLTSEPELINTSTGKELIRYTVASNFGPADNRTASFFRVASFAQDSHRDFILGIPKGSLVHVEADARVSQWEDEKGEKHSGLSLVANKIDVVQRYRPAEPVGQEAASA